MTLPFLSKPSGEYQSLCPWFLLTPHCSPLPNRQLQLSSEHGHGRRPPQPARSWAGHRPQPAFLSGNPVTYSYRSGALKPWTFRVKGQQATSTKLLLVCG